MLRLIISDRKALDDAINASRQGSMGMMGGAAGPPGGTNFTNVFKNEKENYAILNWKFELDDVEEALIAKYNKKF